MTISSRITPLLSLCVCLACGPESPGEASVSPDEASPEASAEAPAENAPAGEAAAYAAPPHPDDNPVAPQHPDDNPVKPLPPGVAKDLDDFKQGAEGSGPFEVVYTDLHGLHGGFEFRLDGVGGYSKTTRTPGADAKRIEGRGLKREKINEVIDLLIELKAWEQQVEERELNADESVAKLTIRIGDQKFQVFEHFNDMKNLNRLQRIKDLLSGI